MLEDLIEALDRRFVSARRSCQSDDSQILAEVHSFTQLLETDSRLAAAYEDLLLDGDTQITRLRESDNQIADLLVQIRNRLAETDPRPHGHTGQPIDPFEAGRGVLFDHEYKNQSDFGLSFFHVDLESRGKSERLQPILFAWLQETKDRLASDDANGLLHELLDVQERISHLRRRWLLFSRADPGANALRLHLMSTYTLPEVPTHQQERTLYDRIEAYAGDLLGHPLRDLRSSTFGENQRPFNSKAKELAPSTAMLVFEAAYEAIRARLGTVRSRLALVQRFALRAQLYDAAELRKLGGTSRPEDALTDRFARYLFDQGLNPLTRPLVGSVQPDLLDVASRGTFYVEAKQYSDARRGRQIIIKGIQQVWDTLGRLRGYPQPVREAFYVVFRLGGARISLPREVRSEGTTVYPVLVDIAPSRETGSRQRRKAINIEDHELMPQAPKVNVETQARKGSRKARLPPRTSRRPNKAATQKLRKGVARS